MAASSNILPRINARNAFYDAKTLAQTEIALVFQRWGENVNLPNNVGDSHTFTEYPPNAIIQNISPLVEGVTPAPLNMTRREVKIPVVQLGNWLKSTDRLAQVSEDGKRIIGVEQRDWLVRYRSEERDRLCFFTLRGGTSVLYANGLARNQVTGVLTASLLRKAERILLNGPNGRGATRITKMIAPGNKESTVPIRPSFVVVICPDLEHDVKQLPGFIPVEKYASMAPVPDEIGSWDGFRFVSTTHLTPFADAGGAVAANNILSTSGSLADVYPMLIFGERAYKLSHLGSTGKNPKADGKLIVKPLGSLGGDILDQRAGIGYKNYFGIGIVFQQYMLRVEVAATDVPVV